MLLAKIVFWVWCDSRFESCLYNVLYRLMIEQPSKAFDGGMR